MFVTLLTITISVKINDGKSKGISFNTGVKGNLNKDKPKVPLTELESCNDAYNILGQTLGLTLPKTSVNLDNFRITNRKMNGESKNKDSVVLVHQLLDDLKQKCIKVINELSASDVNSKGLKNPSLLVDEPTDEEEQPVQEEPTTEEEQIDGGNQPTGGNQPGNTEDGKIIFGLNSLVLFLSLIITEIYFMA
jgi:hypothetical protein